MDSRVSFTFCNVVMIMIIMITEYHRLKKLIKIKTKPAKQAACLAVRQIRSDKS